MLKIRSISPSRISWTMVCSPAGPSPSKCLRTTVACTPLRRSTSAVPWVARISKPRSASRLTGKIIVPLVAVGHGDEHRALGRQRAERRRPGLGERGAEVGVEAHHLAGGLHLRAEDGVDVAAVGRLNRLNGITASLTAIGASAGSVAAVALGGQQALVPQLGDGGAQHHPGRRLGQRGGGRLGDERHRPGGARVGLQHVEHVGAERELDVEQAADPDAAGDRLGGGRGSGRSPRRRG